MTRTAAISRLNYVERTLCSWYGHVVSRWPKDVAQHYRAFDYIPEAVGNDQMARHYFWHGPMPPRMHRHLFWLESHVAG